MVLFVSIRVIFLRVFSPILDCGGITPQFFFLKIQIDFFEIFFITMQNKRFIKNFQHYIEPLKEKENPPHRFFPRGVFPPQNKMGEKPCSKKHFTLCVQNYEGLYQNREISISPFAEILKYTLPKRQCIVFRLMAENGFAPP